MDNHSDKRLIFKLGEESIPTVMSADQLQISPFADTISRAKEKIFTIADQLEGVCYNNEDNNSSQKWIESSPNNIIAFLGDRGSGKTSCMRTLVQELKRTDSNNSRKEDDRWLFANEIDPSFFDENHNVLEILIGSLYGIFKSECTDLNKKLQKTRDDLRKIQDRFREVKAALKYLNKAPEQLDEYEIDALKHLDEGGKIRILLKNLVSELLAYKNKKFLIVTIDDLDLNIKQSYVMMEHIRKHLIIPNVIVVIAAKFTQLFDSICLDLTKVYDGLEYRVTHKDIAEMAERYLNKIFPLDQRFEMPSVEAYMDAELQIIDDKDKVLYDNQDVKLTVPSIIFEKTRYLFYNSSGMPSLVIPRNLRDLRMLVSMLVKMEPYSEKSEIINKKTFKDYFFNEWLGIIQPEFRPFAKSLLEEENTAKINRFVIKNLYDFFLSKIETYSELKDRNEKTGNPRRLNSLYRESELLLDILNPANSYWNVSVGDVVFVMNEVRKSYDAADVLALLFLIESFYSIKLYETYDKLTSMTSNFGLALPDEVDSSAPELKTSVRGDMPEYFRLVGGGFFSPTGDYFTPLSLSNYGASRELTLINGKFLMDFIHKVEKQYHDFIFSDSPNNSTSFPDELSENLRLCEFFMLTIKYREDSRSFGSKYRLANDPLYFKNFGYTARNLVFDITMPFLNAIYPKYAYSRFSPLLYNYAKQDDNSLLNRMTAHRNRDKKNDTWELMSKAAIRNMEILEDLTAWLHNNREDGKLSGPSIAKVLESFYNQFLIRDQSDYHTGDSPEEEQSIPKGKYAVKTYGKTSDGKKKSYYYIDYSIYSELARVVYEIENPDFDINKQSNSSSQSKDNDGDETETGDLLADIDTFLDDAKKSRRIELKNLFYSIFDNEYIFLHRQTYTYEEIYDTLAPYLGPVVVDLRLGGDRSKEFSVEQLAHILAEIRVEDGFDFNHKLPGLLQLIYDKYESMIYRDLSRPLEIKKSDFEDQINQMGTSISLLTDQNRKLHQEITRYEKELTKSEDNTIILNRLIKETKGYLEYLALKIPEAVDKTEYNRLKKEEEKATKSYHTYKASLEEQPNNEELIKKRISESQSAIDKNLIQIDEFKKNRKKIEADLRDVVAELDSYSFTKNHPRPLELKLRN